MAGIELNWTTEPPDTDDVMMNVPGRLSGILAAETDRAAVFRLLTQEIVQAMEGLADGPGA
jgi:hypothetical protein